MAADSPEFGQFGEKGPCGHVADARDGFQKCLSLAPSWGMFDGFADVMVDRVELLLKKSNMACESSGEMLVDGLAATIGFHADHLDDLAIDGPVSRGRGCRRCVPKAYAVAARRLPLRLAADHPASDALVASSVSATPWDLPVAAGRRRSLRQTQVQGLSDRLFSYRHRRGSNRAGQAISHRRDRPDLQIRLRRTAREGDAPHRR